MPLMFWHDKPLIISGKLAIHARCCCATATCDCDDGQCCWSDDATISGTFTATAQFWHNTVSGDLSDSHDMVPANCSGTTQTETDASGNTGDVTSEFIYTVNITFDFTATRQTHPGSACCWFDASGVYDDDVDGHIAAGPVYTPGLTVTITDANGNPVPAIGIAVLISFAHNCDPCDGGWKITMGWQATGDYPDTLAGGCGTGCYDGDCTDISDVTCGGTCERGPDLLHAGHYTSKVETDTLTGLIITNYCCRDAEGNCAPGHAGTDGDCDEGI